MAVPKRYFSRKNFFSFKIVHPDSYPFFLKKYARLSSPVEVQTQFGSLCQIKESTNKTLTVNVAFTLY